MTESRRFEHSPASVTAARRFATEALRAAPGEAVDEVALMVSELASNCIRHTGNGFELTITVSPDEIRVEARDRGVGKPQIRSAGPSDTSGRGLQIVDMLASGWGVDIVPGDGKTVWFTRAVEAPGAEPATI